MILIPIANQNVIEKPKHTKHAVRCCSMDGYTCSSQPCSGDKTYCEAVEICSSRGSRICLMEELNSCCETGCNFDHALTWVQSRKQGGILDRLLRITSVDISYYSFLRSTLTI